MTLLFRSRSPLRSLFSAVALQSTLLLGGAGLSLPAHAVKVMDLRAEQLMVGADSIRKELELTPNQQTLWQQTAAKAQGLLRTRQQRRDKLQADLKAALSAAPGKLPDLRDLNGGIDAEAEASAAEDRGLRELWLVVNDALSDKQRAQVIGLLLSQLERIDADGARGPREGGRGPGGGSGGGSGARGQRPGGMGGAGGGGMGGAGGGMGGSAGFGG